MYLGIDGNEANIISRVGIGQYAYQIIHHLHLLIHQKNKLNSFNNRIKVTVFLKEPPLTDLPLQTDYWQYKIIGPKFLWTQIALPLNLSFGKKPDIFFSPTHYAPRFGARNLVISIMDLSFIRYPEMFTRKDLWQLRNWTSYSVKKAQVIFTISNFSKKEIVDYYKVRPDSVIVTYPGYDRNLFKFLKNNNLTQERIKKLKIKYKINGEYLLFVGTLQPRKNIKRLIMAFNKVQKNSNNLYLVIVGKKGWLYETIFQQVRDLNLKDRVTFTEFVEDKDLPYLYYGAKCLILPSLYEGFGIPVLEAMACGCPVITSNVSSLPEVVDNAGILINPYKVEDITDGIEKVLIMDKIQRDNLIKKGLKRAENYSWEKSAEKILLTLQSLK